MLRELCRAGVEGMTDMSGSRAGRMEIYKELTAQILALVIAILIIAFIGKWLWNNSVVELFSFARPARSVWQIIALMLFWSLIR
jgi:hypothetical protein